ncbi:hypothetical protein GG496_000191 [Candidatus Fervidibacteria bacterium JGI MDM2 JNZ-1-D12]
MLWRDYPWLAENRKPLASVSVKPLPIGSTNFWNEVPLSAFNGSVVMVGEDIALPLSYVREYPLYQGKYAIYGSYSNGSFLFSTMVPISATRGYINLPFNAAMAVAIPFIPQEMLGSYAYNAVTVELVLGIVREFHMILGQDMQNNLLELELRNWMNVLTMSLWLGDRLLWTNTTSYPGQAYYKVSPPYTPLKFTVVLGERTSSIRLASSFVGGTAHLYGYTEQAILIVGLTEVPIFITFPSWFAWLGIGSVWLSGIYGMHEGRGQYLSERMLFTEDVRVNLPESWCRLWIHSTLPFGTTISIPKPFEQAGWIQSHSRVFSADLLNYSGSLTIAWSPTKLPIISKLVVGTTVYYNATPFTYSAPLRHVSYSAELTADAISASGRIEIIPFKLTDWSNYIWVAYPLSQYLVAVDSVGTLFVGARVGHSAKTERNVINVDIELADNQALLKRMTIDAPIVYDYWDSERAARDFLNRFGLAFWRHPAAANMPLMPEFYGERRTNYAWTPRLGELALDFFNRIAQLNGWRVDWTEFGTVRAYPKWDVIGSTWVAYWPTPDIALSIADLLVSRLNVNVSDYERRNILILYGVDAFTNYDVVKIFADIESFAVPWSDRFMPVAVPAFVRFDKPVPAPWMDYLGEWLSKRLFITPFEIQFTMPLFLRIRPGDEIVFANANPMNFHRYKFLVTSVQHEIGREYSTVVTAHAYKEVST